MDDLQHDTRLLNQNIDRIEAKIQQLQALLNSHQDQVI
jgi:ubiquinone biosynthesis protein UbiJ